MLGLFFLVRIIGLRIRPKRNNQTKISKKKATRRTNQEKKLTIRSSKAGFNDIQINFKLLLHLIFHLNYFMNRIDLLPDSNIEHMTCSVRQSIDRTDIERNNQAALIRGQNFYYRNTVMNLSRRLLLLSRVQYFH